MLMQEKQEETAMTNESIIKQVRELKSLKIMAKELADEIAKVEDTLKAEMDSRQAEKLTVDIFTIRYISVTSQRLDSTALKKELPDIAARYTKASTSKRFTVS